VAQLSPFLALDQPAQRRKPARRVGGVWRALVTRRQSLRRGVGLYKKRAREPNQWDSRFAGVSPSTGSAKQADRLERQGSLDVKDFGCWRDRVERSEVDYGVGFFWDRDAFDESAASHPAGDFELGDLAVVVVRRAV